MMLVVLHLDTQQTDKCSLLLAWLHPQQPSDCSGTVELSIPVPKKPTGIPGHTHGAGLTKGHLDQMLGKKKNH